MMQYFLFITESFIIKISSEKVSELYCIDYFYTCIRRQFLQLYVISDRKLLLKIF